MPQTIGRDTTQKLIREGAQVLEVLPPSVYRQGHLPGAINIPLAQLGREAPRQLKQNQPIVVYCYDFQ